MHRTEQSNGTAAAFAIILIGIAIAISWVALSGTLTGAALPDLSGPLAGTEIQQPVAAPLIEGMRIESSVQFSQPRDPFRPLITEDSPGTGNGTGTGNGGTNGEATGTSVTLQEIRDVNGVLRATMIVDGVSYDVGVGDEFAGRFLVVSLDADSGVFLNGDNAFELSVGQQILK